MGVGITANTLALRLLDLLPRKGSGSRRVTELSHTTRVVAPAVRSVLDELADHGLVEKVTADGEIPAYARTDRDVQMRAAPGSAPAR